jgi:hypothetical protein
MILLANEAVVFLFVEAVLLVVLAVGLGGAIPILRRWDFESSSARQYELEKRTHLVVLVIFFALAGKLLMLPFFCHLVDRLAALVPGAMCGAGVIHSHGFGMPLLLLKVVVLALTGLWLIVHREDSRAPDYPYLTGNLRLFVLIFALVTVESVVEFLFLRGIPILSPVQCCSMIYGVAGGSSGLPLGLETRSLLLLAGLLFVLILVLAAARFPLMNFVANAAFLFVGYHAVVHFFGTYIYQLPTHQCPFCMLQREYFYIGYPVWGTLILGAFFGMAGFPLRRILGREVKFTYICNVLLLTVFVLLCVGPVVLYFLRNGVLL